jgi:hypothetical protein
MDIRLEVITPQKAVYYLEKNKKNRPLSMQAVQKYAQEMRSGTFKETGDSIKFDTNDILIDGQHRLQAIVSSGTSHKFIIAENLHEDTFDCLDIGKKRNPSDSLALLGCVNAGRLAAALRVLYILRTEPSGVIPVTKIKSYGVVSNQDIVNLYKQESELEELVRQIGKPHRMALSFAGSGVLGLFFDYWKKDPDTVIDFFTKLSKGIDLQEHHPILYLRNYLIKDSMASTKLPIGTKHWLVATIWQDFKKGTQIRRAIRLPEYSNTSIIPKIQ